MIIAPNSLDTNLSQLLADVSSAKIQLPEFQRSWTWDDNRIRGIIASLSQGYPMGAIMRLQYGNQDIKFKYRTITGVKVQNVEPEYLILDGQQRLTSIFQAIYSNEPVKTKTDKNKDIKRYYYLSMEDCLNDDVDRFDAVISVPEDKKIKENFDRDVKLDLSTRELEYQHKMFPLNIIFDSNLLMDWSDEYRDFYKDNPKAIELNKKFRKEIIETIKGYKLPVITLDKTTPREAVCKVFENVNTGGVPLTVFELVTATFATYTDPDTKEGFDLRKDWKTCKDTIQGIGDTLRTDVLDGIDETTFLTTVTLYTSYNDKQLGKVGAVSCKKKDVLNLSLSDYIKYADALTSGFVAVVLNRLNTSFLLISPNKYCSIIRLAIGAAQVAPKPAFSTTTATAIFGSSIGAKPMKRLWSLPCGFCAVPVFPPIATLSILCQRPVPYSNTRHMPSLTTGKYLESTFVMCLRWSMLSLLFR